MSTSPSTALRELLGGQFPLTPEQFERLGAHYELLVKWSRVLNLTSVRGLNEAAERHYGESLFLAAHLPAGSFRIVDIGSGPGFPGFPVAVVRPDCEVTLVESHQRKAVFLREASRGMPNVKVVSDRAESLSDTFDWAISRAVSYDDLGTNLRRLAPRAALLTGAEAPPVFLGFTWNNPLPLPWGLHRFLRLGTFVSRETTP